ncbi:MAG: hypothetical protein ABEJ95_02425 [Candidatus Nanohalobium sp.]
MNMRKYLGEVNHAPVLALTLVIAAGVGFSAGNLGNSGNGMDSGLEWSNQITIYKNGEQIDQFHNTLTNQGEDYIAGKLFNETANTKNTTKNFAWIALGNGTGVNPSFTQLGGGSGEIHTANLSRALADTYSYSNPAYTLKKTFTANLGSGNPSSIKVNTTGLYFASYSTDQTSLISGGNFTSATLKDGDKITVTQKITIRGK